MRMKNAAVSRVMVCLLFVAVGHIAIPQTTLKGSDGPDLAETISFMNRSVAPESSFVVSANDCEVEVMRNQRYEIAMPLNTYVKSTDVYGVPHYGFHWIQAQEPQLTRFNLSTIDPKSIKSKGVPSPQFVKEHDLDERPEEGKEPDLFMVWFETSNSLNTIDTGHLPSLKEGQSAQVVGVIYDHKSSSGMVVFESKDRAERFVTAFVHAVALCGGSSSDFAPTPSK